MTSNLSISKIDPSKIDPKNVTFTATNHIKELCRPLFDKYGFAYFDYCRLYKNGRFSVLSNHDRYVQQYLEKTENPAGGIHQKTGYHLWHSNIPQETRRIAREEWNLDYGLTLAYQHDDYLEFVDFAATRDGHGVLDLYLNNQDILSNFFLYFKDKASDLIGESIKNPVLKGVAAQFDSSVYGKEEISFPIKKIELNDFFGNIMKLSYREFAISKRYIEGYSATEIAESLHLSRRTVESHIATTKSKLGVSKRDELRLLFQRNYLLL